MENVLLSITRVYAVLAIAVPVIGPVLATVRREAKSA